MGLQLVDHCPDAVLDEVTSGLPFAYLLPLYHHPPSWYLVHPVALTPLGVELVTIKPLYNSMELTGTMALPFPLFFCPTLGCGSSCLGSISWRSTCSSLVSPPCRNWSDIFSSMACIRRGTILFTPESS